MKCYKSNFLFKEWELGHHCHFKLAASICIYPQGLSSLLPSNISAQAGQSLSTDDVCRKHSFMLTALKNQSLKMSRCISELTREAGEKPQLGECCERGCTPQSSLSFTEVVQQVMSNLYLFSLPLVTWYRAVVVRWRTARSAEALWIFSLCQNVGFSGHGSLWCLLEPRAGPNNPMGPSKNLYKRDSYATPLTM